MPRVPLWEPVSGADRHGFQSGTRGTGVNENSGSARSTDAGGVRSPRVASQRSRDRVLSPERCPAIRPSIPICSSRSGHSMA